MALAEEDVARANAKMARLRRTTATAVAACYDRRISRIVIRLSSGLEVAFHRMTPGIGGSKAG